MELGHLLRPAITCQPSGNARRLKSIRPILPAAQHLISSSENNRSAVLCANKQWNVELFDNLTRLRTFITDTHPPGLTLP